MLKRTPLVYMVSPMALTCNHYATKCTKTRTKILQPKNNEKEKNAPGKGQKGRNRVRFGCWRGVQPVRTGGETRNPNQNAPDSNATHEKKETGENPVFSPAFWQGQKDLNPRHAVLETAALPTELYPYVKFCLIILSFSQSVVNGFLKKLLDPPALTKSV